MGVDCYGFNPVIKEGSSKPKEPKDFSKLTRKTKTPIGTLGRNTNKRTKVCILEITGGTGVQCGTLLMRNVTT